jgi:hypothetical protein
MRVVRPALLLAIFHPCSLTLAACKPKQMRGQVAAALIIVFSAALGVYYLLVNPATRFGANSTLRRSTL